MEFTAHMTDRPAYRPIDDFSADYHVHLSCIRFNVGNRLTVMAESCGAPLLNDNLLASISGSKRHAACDECSTLSS